MSTTANRDPKHLSELFVPDILKAGPSGMRSGKNVQFVETMSANPGTTTFGGERELKQLEELAYNIGISNIVYHPAEGTTPAFLESIEHKKVK